MASTITSKEYTGNGSLKTFTYAFQSYQEADVKVKVNEIAVTNFTIPDYTTAGGTVTFNSTGVNASVCESDGSPKNTLTVRVYRETDITSGSVGEYEPKATYVAGSSIKAADLNNNAKQALYAAFESRDQLIQTANIEDGAVTSGKLDADAITGAKIADDTIDSEHYVAGSIDLEHMSANSVDSDQYVDGSIDLAHMSANSVDSDQYVDGSIDLAHMSANSVDSDQYVDGSIDHVHLANDVIDGDNIQDDVINSEHYVAGSIDHEHLANDIIDGDNIQDDVINSEHYAAGSIDLEHMSANSVDSDQYVDGSIDSAHIANDQIDSQHYAAASIDNEHLADDAVGADELAANAVVNDSVASGAAIEFTKLENLDSAKILVGNSSNKAAEVAVSGDVTLANTGAFTIANDAVEIGMIGCEQTTISDSDSHLPTSGAVVDYVAAQIAPIGGLEVIADEDNFPTSQPSSGVVISINDIGGLITNGSGVATNARTAGNGSDNVTINGFPSTLYSKTFSDNLGLMVSSTGSSNIYNYHKLLGKEADIAQLSEDIQDFAARYRVASSEPGSNNDEGDLLFDTTANKMKVYDGSAWGEVASTGEFKFLVPVNPGTTTAADWGNTGLSSGNSGTSWDLRESTNTGSAASITSALQLLVSINGVVQKANTGSWSGSGEGFYLQDSDTIRFATAPAAGASVFVIQIGAATTLNVPADNSVTGAKIALGSDASGDIMYYNGTDYVRLAKGSDGEVLKLASGAPSWAADSSSDATKMPLAGGTFTGDVTWDNGTNSGKDMIWDESDDTLKLNDDVQISLGSDRDVRLYHTGSHGYINVVTGDLNIRTNGTESAIICTKDAGVALYYDAAKKVETVTGGVTVTGVCTATSFAGDGSALTGLAAGATGGNSGGNAVFWENEQTVTHDYTITNNRNAGSFGPITINSGITVTVGSGEYWTIV